MRRAAILCVVVVVLAILPAAASAQLQPQRETGSLIPVQPNRLDQKAAGIVRKGFAQCIYQRARPKVLIFLQHTDLESVDLAGAKIRDVKRDLRLADCLSEQVGFTQLALGFSLQPQSLRDMLAEEVYLAANRATPALPMSPQPLNGSFISIGDALDQAKSLSAFIDCTILKDIPDADALLRTMPGSDKEHDAAAALAPALGACLNQGHNVVLTPASIRGFIAFGMWNRFARVTAEMGMVRQ